LLLVVRDLPGAHEEGACNIPMHSLRQRHISRATSIQLTPGRGESIMMDKLSAALTLEAEHLEERRSQLGVVPQRIVECVRHGSPPTST
jgi:hypothetical protein